jgi:CheY-like chemotaxis protein
MKSDFFTASSNCIPIIYRNKHNKLPCGQSVAQENRYSDSSAAFGGGKVPGKEVERMVTQDRAHIVLWSEVPGELGEVRTLLERHGYSVQTASSLEGVSVLAESGRVNLVVGWLCGGYGGPLKLLSRLKAHPAPPPVLVVSCGLDVHLYLQAMQHGAFDCVALPLNETELVRIVSEALQSAALRLSA